MTIDWLRASVPGEDGRGAASATEAASGVRGDARRALCTSGEPGAAVPVGLAGVPGTATARQMRLRRGHE